MIENGLGFIVKIGIRIKEDSMITIGDFLFWDNFVQDFFRYIKSGKKCCFVDCGRFYFFDKQSDFVESLGYSVVALKTNKLIGEMYFSR